MTQTPAAAAFDHDAYESAFDTLHSQGCTVHPIEKPGVAFERPTGEVLVDAPDGTVYRMPASELALFVASDDVTPWQVEGS